MCELLWKLKIIMFLDRRKELIFSHLGLVKLTKANKVSQRTDDTRIASIRNAKSTWLKFDGWFEIHKHNNHLLYTRGVSTQAKFELSARRIACMALTMFIAHSARHHATLSWTWTLSPVYTFETMFVEFRVLTSVHKNPQWKLKNGLKSACN